MAALDFLNFSIELDNQNGVYYSGEKITGRLIITPSERVEVVDLDVEFKGVVKVKYKKVIDAEQKLFCQKNDATLKHTTLDAKNNYSVQFLDKIPRNLMTSVETKNVSVLYTVTTSLSYKLNDALKTVSTIKGFTVIQVLDLNDLYPKVFEVTNLNLTRKFGLFSCTGGNIKLQCHVCRSAFVCGENISIAGRIENKTDRRIDKVVAALQQVVIYTGDENNDTENASETRILDVTDIHEEHLALFVDEGKSIRIEKNFPVPAVPPSTITHDLMCLGDSGSERALASGWQSKRKRMSMNAARLSFSSVGRKKMSEENRLFQVIYQLCIKVKTGGVEVMEISTPIIIGCEPYDRVLPRPYDKLTEKEKSRVSQPITDDERNVTYRLYRKDRTVVLVNDNNDYFSTRSQLTFVNKYPYFADLPTSTKQKTKTNILATALKAEASFLNGIRQTSTVDNASYTSEQTIQLPNAIMD